MQETVAAVRAVVDLSLLLCEWRRGCAAASTAEEEGRTAGQQSPAASL